MGNSTSTPDYSSWGISPPVNYSSLLSGDPTSKVTFNTHLREHGFTAITIDSDENTYLNLIQTFCSVGQRFFALPPEKKQAFKESIEKIDNRGYVLHPTQKEYIKIRLEDKTEEQVPVEKFATVFKESSAFFLKVAEVCFNTFATSEINGKEVLDKTVQDSIKDIAADISSLSLIHYFKQDSIKKADEYKNTEEKPSYEDEHYSKVPPAAYDPNENTILSKPHKDTGIFTFGVVLNVSGLLIWSNKTETWIPVDKIYPQNTIVLWSGEKVPLFAGSRLFQATPHQVILNKHEERLSLIFLYDVGK